MIAYIAEGMHADGIQLLNDKGIRTVFPNEDFDAAQIEIVIVRSVFQVNAATLKIFPGLRMVAKLGTGLDNIDQDFCRTKGIKVLNASGLNSISTAEFTVSQIVAYYKNIFEINRRVENRDLRRARYFGHELSGLTAVIVGYGTVGKNVVKRLAPFVKKFYICDLLIKKEEVTENLHFVPGVDPVLPECDIVIICLPLKGNQQLVNKDFLSQVKDDLLLVNAARGGLVDEKALMEFLKNNPKAFYYCDVVAQEPDYSMPPEQQNYNNPLLELNNVSFTPHIAGMTHECQQKIAVDIAGKIISAMNLAGKD